MYRKNTASQFVHFQGVDASTGGIKTGVTWTIRRCIDGTFAAGGGTVTEDGSTGWYKCALSQADTNGNDIAFNFTGTGAVPQTVNILTTAADPSDTVRFGLTALPNAAAEAAGGLYTRGSGAGQITQDANGRIDINVKALLGTAWLTPGVAGTPDVNAKLLGGTAQTGRDIGASVLLSTGTGTGQLDFTSGVVKANVVQLLGTAWLTPGTAGTPDVSLIATVRPGIRKNTALANFEIVMTDSTNHNPATGKTVSITRSIDHAAFGAGTLGAVTELANGVYYFDWGAGDLNGDIIMLRATATGCDDLLLLIRTNP